MDLSALYHKLISNKYVALFFREEGSVELLSQHLNPLNLHFKNKGLERHYYAFINKTSVFAGMVCLLFSAAFFFVYIAIDISYDHFFQLLILRTLTGGLIVLLFFIMLLFPGLQRHAAPIATTLLPYCTISAMISLLMRRETDYSPLFMTLLWINLYFIAPKIVPRTLTGLTMIVAHAFVWIYAVEIPAERVLQVQTLNYVLFYIGIVSAAYGQEIRYRKLYLNIHDLLCSITEIKSYAIMFSGNMQKSGSKRAVTSSSSRDLPALTTVPSTNSVGGISILVQPSPTSSPSLSPAPSADAVPSFAPPSASFVVSSSSFNTLTQDSSASLSPTPASPPPMQPSAEWFDALQDRVGKFWDRLNSNLTMGKDDAEKLKDIELPTVNQDVGETPGEPDLEEEGPARTDIGYSKAVFSYVQKCSHRVTLRFNDKEREKRFSEWHLQETEVSVRRFLLLNFISYVTLITQDLGLSNLTHYQRSVLIIIRFGAIVPSILICFGGSIHPTLRKWRRSSVVVMEMIVAVASLAMAVYACDAEDGDETAYDMYYGSVARITVYGFSGMGLLWMQSTITATVNIIIMYIATFLFGISLALTPLLIIMVGFVVAYSDERKRRTEFFLHFYTQEIRQHLRIAGETKQKGDKKDRKVKEKKDEKEAEKEAEKEVKEAENPVETEKEVEKEEKEESDVRIEVMTPEEMEQEEREEK